ncbi:SemiSWEET family sugar transporter [Spiroplasma sp. DGKH1]|uniref:SemiSWEET family sugar transporter n=1 Tax=Spiroplasma sp. DGKH1 TaxID=3050074 RepID=UPI0034C68F5E
MLLTSFRDDSLFLTVHIIGWLAALVSMSAFIPQAIKTIKTKQTAGISLGMYLIYNMANFAWIIWAIIDWDSEPNNMLSDLTVIIPNLVCIIITSIIIRMKVINTKKSSPLH